MNNLRFYAVSNRQPEQPIIPSRNAARTVFGAPAWQRYDWSLANLGIQAGDRILAFGCGSGLGLSLCLACGAAKVVGFDPSLLKLMIAYRRNRAAYLLGRLSLRHGGPEALGDSDTPVEKVLYTNITDCLDDRPRILQALSSVVVPGGRIVVTTQPLATAEIATAAGEDLRLTLISIGWIGTRVETLPLRRGISVCVSGHQPP